MRRQRLIFFAVRGLVAIGVAIAAIQFAASQLGVQSSWKGGGFGMYTEPHPIKHVIWLVLETAGEERPVRLWPRPEIAVNSSKHDSAILDAALEKSYLLVTSGDHALTDDIKRLAAKLNWAAGPDGTTVIGGANALEVTGMRVEHYQLRFDMSKRSITTRRIDG